MKKVKCFIFSIILMLVGITNIYAKDIFFIKSITLDSKSDNTVVNKEPVYSGLEMNYDLTFKNINDFAKYKIVLENNSNKEYKVSENKSFEISKYVSYSYTSDTIIKANKETELFIIIKYNKEVEPEKLTSEGTYKETNKAEIKILDKNGEVVNPKTGVFDYKIVFLAIIATALGVMFLLGDKKVYSLIIAICLLPVMIYAIEELKLVINADIKIEPTSVENGIDNTEPEPTPVVVEKYNVSYVYYLFGYSYIKESELSNYDISEANCIEPVYVCPGGDENKYIPCNGTIKYKDSKKYESGQTVTLIGPTLKVAYDISSTDPNSCIDNSEFDEYKLHSWAYFRSTDYNKELLDFGTESGNEWDKFGYVSLYENSTFTMPSYDVEFSELPK